MKRQSKAKLKRKLLPEKSDNEVIVFVGTFIKAFLIILIILTPILAAVNTVTDILESTPGDEDGPVLEEELDVLIPADSPFFEVFSNVKRVNILLLGVNENEGLTDTIMVASFDTEHKHIDLISIPRDTYYYRGDGYKDPAQHKLNAVYRKNPVNSAKAVSEILMNMPINYYVVLSYEGVAKIVDEMRGVPMDIPFHMKYDDPLDKPPLHVDIQQGQQTLDGAHAIQFLRFRHGNEGYKGYPDEDLGRIKAHQQFMKNAFKQCLGFDLPKIATVAYENIQSDIKLKTVLYLAGKAVGITSDDITTYTIPNKYVPPYIRPDAAGIEEMLREIYSLETEDEETDPEADIPSRPE